MTSNAATYRSAVGDIDAMVVSDGQIGFPAHPTYAPGVAEKEVHESMRRHGLTPPDYTLDANSLLLRANGRTVLVDTGWGAFAPAVGHTARRLREAGVDPSSIDMVVLSHVHPDHVGGLRDADGELVYANAQVVVAERELEQWGDAPDFGAMRVDDGFKPVFAAAARSVRELGERLEPVAPGREIAPGIAIAAAPGHTRGHSALRVSSGDATFLYAADAFHDPAFDLAHPSWSTAFDHTPDEAERTRRAILDEAAVENELLMAYHVPFPGIGFVSRDRDRYLWRPVRWDASATD